VGLAIEKDKCYTAADFFEWEPDSGERYELADGGAYMMAGCSRRHEEINDNLFMLIRGALKGKPCRVYSENFAVRLFPDLERKDNCVFLPDIFVVCDRKKLDERACNGAPDLIIEVLSPSTARFDRLVKFNKYLEACVKEYWIVDPELNTIQVHRLGTTNNSCAAILHRLCPHFFAQNALHKPIMLALLGFKLWANSAQSCLPLVIRRALLQNKRYVTSVYNDEAKIDVLSLPGLTINTQDVFTAEEEGI
jgi:Uma2 family endonuclease